MRRLRVGIAGKLSPTASGQAKGNENGHGRPLRLFAVLSQVQQDWMATAPVDNRYLQVRHVSRSDATSHVFQTEKHGKNVRAQGDINYYVRVSWFANLS